MLTPAQHYYTSALITSIVVTALTLFVLVKSPNRPLARRFFFWAFPIAFWSFFVFWCTSTFDHDLSYILARICHVGAVLAPIGFYHFVLEYTGNREKKYHDALRLFYALSAAVIVVIVFKPKWFIPDVVPKLTFNFLPDDGIVFRIWNAILLAVVLCGFYVLFIESRKRRGDERKAMFVTLTGNIIGYAGVIGCIMPVYGYGVFPFPYGMWGTALCSLMLAVAALRYRMLDIELIVKKATIFALLLASTYGVFLTFSYLGQVFLESAFKVNPRIAVIPTLMLVIFIYRPLENFLTNLTDKYLFQKRYEYKGILKLFIDDVLRILDLEQIIEGTRNLIDNTIHPTKFSVYLIDSKEDKYIAHGEQPGTMPAFGADSALVNYARQLKNGVISIERPDHRVPKDVRDEMISAGAVLAVSLESQNDFLGFMILGKKRSDEDYSKEDLDVLQDLSKAEAIAIMNSKANEELSKTKTLEGLGAMADGMSHQFNNCFASMTTQLELQNMYIQNALKEAESTPLDVTSKKYIDLLTRTETVMKNVVADAMRGGGIARSVLILTRPEKAGFKMQNIADTLESSIRHVGFIHKDIYQVMEIKTHIEEDLPQTWSNESLLSNIYQIAIHNTYDAIKKWETEHPNYEGFLTITFTQKAVQGMIRAIFQDNGIGMRPYILQAVNAGVPYVSTKGSSSQRSGFGAGVHTLASYVKLLAGNYRYESEWNKGTILTIDIPVMDKEDFERKTKEKGKGESKS